MSELKPCPLCGREAEMFDLAGWEILCDCGIAFATIGGDREGVIKAWNTRDTQHFFERACAAMDECKSTCYINGRLEYVVIPLAQAKAKLQALRDEFKEAQK